MFLALFDNLLTTSVDMLQRNLFFFAQNLCVHPRISTHNMKSKSENPNFTTPKIKSNSKFEPMLSTYKRQFPKVRKQSSSTIHVFSGIENVACKKKGFACAPPGFFLSKETRYWLLQALGGTQYICMNTDYKIYGNV